MNQSETLQYTDIIDRISNYQDHCFGCPHYRQHECGFAFPDMQLAPAERMLVSIGGEVEPSRRRVFQTQCSGEPCEERPNSAVFLNSIEKALEDVPRADEDTVVIILRRLYRVINKYSSDEPLLTNTQIKKDVERAINLILSKLDYEALEDSVSIYRLLKAAGLGYTQSMGLFKFYPKEMAISLMKHCLVQNQDGYYESDGVYDPGIEDVTIKLDHFIGRDWLAVEQYMKQALPTIPESRVFISEETPVENALQKCLDTLTSTDTMLFLQAFDFCFGIHSQRPYTLIDSGSIDWFIDRYIEPKESYSLSYFDDVVNDLSEEIGQRKHSEHELTIYIAGLISRFDGISRMLYPAEETMIAAAMPEVYRLVSQFENCPVKVYAAMVSNVMKQIDKNLEPCSYEFCDEFDRLLYEQTYVPDSSANVLLAVQNIQSAIYDFECSLEAALLINGIKHDYHYYTERTGVKLMGSVSAENIANLTGLTQSTVAGLIIDLNHDISLAGLDVKKILTERAPHASAQSKRNTPSFTDNVKLMQYLDALKDEGYLSEDYAWISIGHTNYHAGWAAKIIISNVEGVHYNDLTSIIGISGLSDHASKCRMQGKQSKIDEIEACFKRHGLAFTTL